ncbi:hypothetical protein [Nocardia bovistercoris]|uniref:DUF4386 domain-containing protein n=1 Tax=Nocardia bovistercoris TaxID=2785916 RepID=A0A931I9V1_9NOCA|nr:hypothetical protein [Nocardia bovistercoris]MBH0776716.1 hypothetical protein [Nocardia bovistercoris]
MSQGVRRLCAWCGPAFVAVFFLGVVLTGLLPPPSPADSAAEVAHFWSTHTDVRRIGIVLMMFAATLQAPFGAIMAVRIKSIEGRAAPLAYTMIVGTALAVMAIILPVFMFAAASYRPERSPEITQALNDLAWLPFVMNLPAALLQCLALALSVLGDRRATPLWPRWVGYYNLWTAFLFCGGGFAVFFKSGAFAWNGVLAFWMPAVVFGSWFLIMCYLLLRVDDQVVPELAPEPELAPR